MVEWLKGSVVFKGLKRERVKCCVVVCCVDMIFTRNNVQTAVRDVRETDTLGHYLGVSVRRRREIESQFRGSDAQLKKKYLDYFMDHDPSSILETNHCCSRCIDIIWRERGSREDPTSGGGCHR